MRHLGLFSSLCLTASAAMAAGPVPDYLRHHAETRGFMLGRPLRPRPTPDGKAVLFLRAAPRTPELRLYEFDTATRKTRELLTPAQLLRGADEQLSAEERARRERMRMSLRGFTWFDLSKDGGTLLVALSGRLYIIARHDLRVRELRTGPGAAVDPQLSPDGRRVAYVRERDLFVLDLAESPEPHELRLTQSPHPGVSYGLSEFVAQEEMHRFSGFLWAPDSQRLLVEEADTREVETLHILDPAHPERAPATFAYPRPGHHNARVRLCVLTVPAPRHPAPPPLWLTWDSERFPYVATLRWSEGGPLTVVTQSRDQHHLEVLAFELPGVSGLLDQAAPTPAHAPAPRRLVTEHDPAWVNLDQDMPRWLKDGSGFLWTSDRSGGPELELRAPDGHLVRVLVGRDQGYQGLVDVDEAARQVVYAASPDATQRHLHRVSLSGGAAQALTHEPGHHTAVFGKDHRLFVQVSSTLQHMPQAQVLRLSAGGVAQPLGELESTAETPPMEPNVELTVAGPRALRAALIRPRAFQPGRRYPVVVDVYGGPGHLHVSAQRGRWLLMQWLADHGFIVVSADGRGTPGRGRDFERALRGNFAKVTLDDQIEALQALGERYPELDLSRVGIYGWSFGGYMAALGVLRRPDVFHVGVAGAPVVDWHDYDTHYTERYLGLPAENPTAYEDSSLLPSAANLRRPLLLIHGTGDDNVYFSHSLKLSDALFRAGRPHDFLPLSGLTHMVPDATITIHLWGRILGALSAVLRP